MAVTSPFTEAYCQARIDALAAQVVAWETAILDLASGATQQYSLDTGQTRTVVTKYQVGSVRIAIDAANNQIAMWLARCNGASSRFKPGW